MIQGKTLEPLKAVAESAVRPEAYVSIEEFQIALAGTLTSELVALYEVESAYGRNWASLNADADNTSPDCFSAIHGAIQLARIALQKEGFQTEEAYDEFDGRSHHQLSISRPGVTDIYDNQFYRPGHAAAEFQDKKAESNNDQAFEPRIIS